MRVDYFQEVDQEAQLLWAELQTAPPDELLDRQISAAQEVIKEPDLNQLMGVGARSNV